MIDSAAAPFAFGDGPDACLLLHGFTGAPSELRPLGERLARDGMRVSAPLLPGHGKSAEELVGISRGDLILAAEAALAELRGARRIFLAGLSAGAMLAIDLAAQSQARSSAPQLTALALLAPAARFTGSTWFFTQAIGRSPLGRLPLFLNKGARDVKESAVPVGSLPGSEVRSDGSLTRVPLRWGRELRLLSSEALARASEVRVPTLLLHGGRDRTADIAGSHLLMKRLGARDLELRVFASSGHILPIDRDGPAVCDAIAGFFARIANGGERGR